MQNEDPDKVRGEMFDGFVSASRNLLQLTSSGHIESEGGRYEWAYLKPSKALGQVLAADREVLLLVTSFREQQARTMRMASKMIESSRGRLESTLAIIVHSDSGGNLKLQSWGREQGITVLPYYYDRSNPPKSEADIESALCRELYSSDLFDVTGPVSDDRNFYGRRSEAQDLARQLQTGQIRTSLGIRKIGKTSIVNRIVEEAGTNHECICLMVDCSRDEIWQLTGPQLIASIAYAVRQCIDTKATYGMVVARQETKELVQAAKLLRDELSGLSTPLIIFFDEIDYITPGSPTAFHWKQEFNPFWRNLRAIYQEAARAQKRVSLFVSGVSSKWFKVRDIDGVENAALALVPEEYLSPLARGASIAMLKNIGRRVGLQFGDDVSDLIAETGGDIPFWIRKAGSFIHRNTDIVGRPKSIDVDTASKLLKVFVEQEGATIASVALSHLFNVYPELRAVVKEILAKSGDVARTELLSVLQRYGVVRSDKSGWRIAGAMMSAAVVTAIADEPERKSGGVPEAAMPAKLAIESIGEWAEELAVLNRRRNLIERKLRGMAVNFIRYDSVAKGKKSADRMLLVIDTQKRGAISHLAADEMIEKFTWLDLTKLILKEWSLFERVFGDKALFENHAMLVNERPDAHAKHGDLADLALYRRSLQFFEDRIGRH